MLVIEEYEIITNVTFYIFHRCLSQKYQAIGAVSLNKSKSFINYN